MVTDELFTITQAAKRFPNRPCVASVWRWAQTGCRGVILKTTLLGGRRYCSQADIDEFIERLNAPRTAPSVDTRASQSADAALEAAGF